VNWRRFRHGIGAVSPCALSLWQSNPRPNGAVAYAGIKGGYRVRVGDYRIAYQIDDAKRVVHVIRIGDRDNVYKDR